MAADEISICNQAIGECGGGELGAPRIQSFVDGTSLSTLCGEFYPDTRDMVLTLHPFNFATAFARLTPQPVPSGDASEFKWTYMYQLPTQPYCLAVRGTDQGNGARFEIGTNGQGHRMLFSEEAQVGIEYTKRVEDLGTWTPLALQVLIKLMASKLAKPLTGQSSLADQKLKEAYALIPEAKGADAREGSPYRLPAQPHAHSCAALERRGRGTGVMVSTVPCTPAHVAQMVRDRDRTLPPAQLDRALTACAEDEPLCCWGVTTVWPGVGVAWFLERQPWTTHPLASRLARAVARSWWGWQREFRYVEALVAADRADARRLVEWLGFVPVVMKPGYGPRGETMIEYAWRKPYGLRTP